MSKVVVPRICAHCSTQFVIGYRLAAKRLARPAYCSDDCHYRAKRERSERDLRKRFMLFVPTGAVHECWEWTGRLSKSGYGNIDFEKRPHQATRVMWFLTHGEWPSLNVCHSCDNPPCVNPAHLWLGTDLDNVRDMILKGRARRGPPRFGPDNHNTKLTADAVRAIRASKLSNSDLAKQYSVTPSAVYNVRAWKAWKHV